jgi:hypothetical protein
MSSETEIEEQLLQIEPSRREIISRAIAVLGASTAGISLAASIGRAGTIQDTPPTSEGFFLIAPTKGDKGEDRIFFLKSSWLQYFEVTDQFGGSTRDTILKRSRKADYQKWYVLYGDDLESNNLHLVSQPSVEVPPPPSGGTYLAMSISPSV